ncbi:Peptidase C14, caspase catalytic subunit p20 [Beggiatoa sp. PS]|nr:Peptidase C14, caspase catalytic subunit p20 [Beggiatoa sp. PS]
MKFKLISYQCVILFLLILTGCSNQPVSDNEPKRLALFFANQAYEFDESQKEYVKLNNPINDAKKVADSLKKAGFTSFIFENLPSKGAMEQALESFLRLVDDNDIVLFYFAGHGVQEDGKSYLIPTKAKTLSKADLAKNTFPAQYVMQKLYAKGERKKEGINIFVLDTCRTPHSPDFSELKGDLVSVGGGNTMVIFSTKANKQSAEGEKGTNSPFAKSLIEGISRWHWRPLEDMLQAVGKSVREKEEQEVYVYGWVGKPFCLSHCLGTKNITITP